jgi:DNA topoisomerase III
MEGERVEGEVHPRRTTRGHRKPANAASGEPLGKCPKCGSLVVETKKSYGCSGWREGCKFAIWKTVSGKRLSEGQAKQLLKNGRTPQMQGFKTKAGKPYAAALKLDQDHRVRLDFEGV